MIVIHTYTEVFETSTLLRFHVFLLREVQNYISQTVKKNPQNLLPLENNRVMSHGDFHYFRF